MLAEEEDSVPLTDLLRTGEASRLRRRGAMRGGHRREDSEELPLPVHRRVRVESAEQRGEEDRHGGEISLQLTCGVRTGQFSLSSSTPIQSSVLPQPQSARHTHGSGVVFASTGCGTLVNARATPRQPGFGAAHQIYTSSDLSNPHVARLPSRYLEPEQRTIAEFLSREDCTCHCDWEAIACRACGNALGFLFIPCHSRHSLDNTRGHPRPNHVFFPSSVTPSPAYTFSSIDPSLFRTLPPLVALSESDDMSIDSPRFSRRIAMTPGSEAPNSYGYAPRSNGGPPRDEPFGAPFPSFYDQSLVPTEPSSPTTPTPLALSTQTGHNPSSSHPDPEREQHLNYGPPLSHGERLFSRPRRASGVVSETRGGDRPASPILQRAARLRHQEIHRAARQVISDDDLWRWSHDVPGEMAPPPRRSQESASGAPGDPSNSVWVPRDLRERSQPSEERPDRSAPMESPEPSSGSQLPNSSTARTRTPDPPALHRVPRRPFNALSSSVLRTGSFDSSWWASPPPRPLSGMPPSRPGSGPERHDPTRDIERASRLSRWATTLARPTRRTTAPTPSSFTLVDSAGERSYPPSARSSLDARDTLGVDWEADVLRLSRRWLNSDDVMGGDSERGDAATLWSEEPRTEEPDHEADDEEKADDERRSGEASERGEADGTGGPQIGEQMEGSTPPLPPR